MSFQLHSALRAPPHLDARLQSPRCTITPRGHTHLTFAATEDIASLLRFFLLDTAVPMLKWTRPRRENADHSTDWSARETRRREKKNSRKKRQHKSRCYPASHDFNELILVISSFRLHEKMKVPGRCCRLGAAAQLEDGGSVWSAALSSSNCSFHEREETGP